MSAVRRWDGLTREEIGALAADALLVLPVGSTEQHGPHLATGTDALIATAVAERAAAAAAARPETIVLADARLRRLGSPSPIRRDALAGRLDVQLLLRDLLASAASAGFRRVFVLNGHGGNAAACAIAVAEASRRHGLLAAAAMPSDLVEAGEIEGPLHGHAGSFETSLVLVLDPDRVRPDLARPSPGGGARPRPRGLVVGEPGAGRSSTASPTGPTRPRASAASRRSPRAWPPSPPPSSSSPAPVPEIRGPTIAAVETAVSARAKPALGCAASASCTTRRPSSSASSPTTASRVRRGERDRRVERRGCRHGDPFRPRRARTRLIGRPLAPIESHATEFDRVLRGNWFTKAGVSTALWDALARVRGVTVAELLGGPTGARCR